MANGNAKVVEEVRAGHKCFKCVLRAEALWCGQLASYRQELEELVARKRLVEEQIAHIEQQIYSFEESYLEDTNATGNVIKGFDNYLGLRPVPPDKRKQKIKDTDRLFSRTSATFEKVALRGDRLRSQLTLAPNFFLLLLCVFYAWLTCAVCRHSP